jgi:hypothetical protein
MPTTTSEDDNTQGLRRGAGYYFLLIALLVFSGLYFGFAIPTFLALVGLT